MIAEDVLQSIKKLVNDDDLLVIHQASPPNYLLPFINENNLLYIYKQKEVSDSLNASNQIVKGPFSDETLEELELTGQPLECPFDLDETTNSEKIVAEKREEDNHCPLTLKEAKDIITHVNLLKKDVDVPLFVLTDGFDKNHTILLGSARKNGWFTRSWITLEDISKNVNTDVNVKDMVQNHHKTSLINPIHTDSNVTGKYIIESLSGCHTTFMKDSPGRLEVNLSWKTPTFTVPINETSVEINIESCISNDTSEISHLWDQLTLLYDYLEIIKAWKSERSAQVPYSRHCVDFPNIKQLLGDDDLVKPTKDVTQLLLEPNQITGATLTGRNADFEKKPLEDIVRTIINEKKEQEFTDRLWTLLIRSCSYEEIRSCIEVVFQYVRNGSSKPYMKTTNVTRLAHVLRCCKGDSSHSEMILEPLELLVEIGIEKLKKEYISVYLLAKIATSEQLNIPSLAKFPEVKADDWIDHCCKWITWLMRVHITLQLMLVMESIMKSKVCILPLTTLTLKHYTSEKSPISELINPRLITTQSFNTAVNTRDVLELLNRKTPFNSWTLTLRSAVADREVISIYHRSMDEIFPSSIGLAGELGMEDNATFTSTMFSYHGYDFNSVSDLLLD